MSEYDKQSPDDYDALDEALNRERVTWPTQQCVEGDKARGTDARLGEREGNWGVYPTVAVVGYCTVNGERIGSPDKPVEVQILGFHTVLRNKIMESNVENGDTFGAVYKGKVMGGNGEYRSYDARAIDPGTGREKVARRRPSGSPDDDAGGVADAGSPPPNLSGFGSVLEPRDDDLEPF